MPRGRFSYDSILPAEEVEPTPAEKDIEALTESFAELQARHDSHRDLAKSIEAKVTARFKELEEAETRFAETKSKVEHSLETFKNRVKLNVGGHRFETTLTTLGAAGESSMLTAMFSGRHELQTNDDSEVFIDRDGTHFGQILNLLRNANVEVAHKDRVALEAELDFYGITEARERLSYAHR